MDILHQTYEVAQTMPATATLQFLDEWAIKLDMFFSPVAEALGKLELANKKPDMKEIIPRLPHPSTWVKKVKK